MAPYNAKHQFHSHCQKGLLVWFVYILDGQDGQIPVISEVAQRNLRAGLDGELINLCLVDVEGDGHAEEQAILEAVLLDDSVVILLGHETCVTKTIASVIAAV